MSEIRSSMPIQRGFIHQDDFKFSDKDFAHQQLNKLSDTPVTVGNEQRALPSGSVLDLPRFGRLSMRENGKERTVYQFNPDKGIILPSGQPATLEDTLKEITHAAQKAWTDNENVIEATGGAWMETVQYAKLLHQNAGGVAEHELLLKHERRDTHVFRQREKAVLLEVNDKDFKVEYELLGKIVDQKDMEEVDIKPTYVKVKTIIEGKREDLVTGAHNKITTKVMHTQEVSTEKEARSLKYGPWYDFSDSVKSQIK